MADAKVLNPYVNQPAVAPLVLGQAVALSASSAVPGASAVKPLPLPVPMPVLGAAPIDLGEIIHPSMVDHRDRRADLLWGGSKTGKGINAWMAAYWMAKRHGKKFLYLTAEPGSTNTSINAAIRAGLGDQFSLVGAKHLLAVLSAILEGGKWPLYRKRNDGAIIRDFESRDAFIDPSEYGLMIVDSLTSTGDEMIRWLADPDNKATLPMTPGKEKFWIEDQGVKIGGSGMTHVGFATKMLHQFVVASANLPLMKILWISREQRASRGEKKDKDGNILVAGEPMYGPDIPGTAATPRVTSWFGGAYHTDAVPIGEGTSDARQDATPMMANVMKVPTLEYRLYLRKHPDPRTGFMYDAGNRMPAVLNANHKIVPPYIVCSEQRTPEGGYIHKGINTVWDIEADHCTDVASDLRQDLGEMLAKFKRDTPST